MVVLTEKQLTHVNFGIDNDIPLSIETLDNGKYQTKFSGNAEYLREISSANYRKTRLSGIADSLTSTLYHRSLGNMEAAENSLEVMTAKKFCRKVSRYLAQTPYDNRLKRQLLASRLAIPVEAFEANPGFYEFASKHHLYHYMRHYGHHLMVDPKTYELKILSENEWRAWGEVERVLTVPLDTPKNQPKQPWVYGPKGVQNKDMYHWKELSPYKYDDPVKWGNRWILEICACNESSPQKNGDHSWFRLKTPTGEIYSIGLYRPEKSGILDNFNEPFRIKKGHLMQPDLSEAYPCHIHTIQYEINEEIFQKIKWQCEEDKRKDEELFQAIGINCTQYVNKIAGIAGLHLPTKKRIWRFLTPKSLENVVDGIAPYIPELIKKVLNVVAAVFINIILVCLGATKNDPTVLNGGNQPVKPHISSFWDLFDPDKASLHHPHTLGWDVYHSVNKWRCQELKSLKKQLHGLLKHPSTNESESKSKISNINRRMIDILYDVPDKYKKK